MIHDKKGHANKSVVPDTAKYPNFTEQNSENSSRGKVFLSNWVCKTSSV